MNKPKKLITEVQVHEMLGITLGALRTMRARPPKDPLPFYKVGRFVRYDEADVLHWLERRKCYGGKAG